MVWSGVGGYLLFKFKWFSGCLNVICNLSIYFQAFDENDLTLVDLNIAERLGMDLSIIAS